MQHREIDSSMSAQSAMLTHRYTQLQDWLQQINQSSVVALTKLAGDASFRCYYRLVNEKGSFVIMDAPPDKEPCQPFVEVSTLLRSAGVMVPTIYHQDLDRGFLLLSDLGDDLYFSKLTAQNADLLYQYAFDTLIDVARISETEKAKLPAYDKKKLLNEMQLFADWYLAKHKKFGLNAELHQELHAMFGLLVDNALQQPSVCVHRDFHSRNLLLCDQNQVGVLDFQDAVRGPITYDLVSLLRDCYLEWPQAKIDAWVNSHYLALKNINLLENVSLAQFTRWFDLMGLQRHLKCLGIFVRLHLRDQKPNYLDDIPRVLKYAKTVCNKYQELNPLLSFLERE